MRKVSLFVFIISIVVVSCQPKVENVYTEVSPLRASAIYNNDSIYSYVKSYHDSNKVIADSYLLKAKNIEETNMQQAIYFTKRAVTLNPTITNYKALLDLFNKTQDYKEANKVCTFLLNKAYIKSSDGKTYLDTFVLGKPGEEIYYEYLVARIAEHNHLSSDDIYIGEDLAFDIPKMKKKLFADNRIKIDTTTKEGKNILLALLSDERPRAYSGLESTFKDFLSSIEDTSAVFEINKDNVHQFKYENFNGQNEDLSDEFSSTPLYAYMYYLQEKQSDSAAWVRYNLNHFVDINENVKAVVYAVDSSATACPIEMRHIYHRLVTYGKDAIIIDSKIIALQSGEQLQTVAFNNRKFKITTFKRLWKKPYVKDDFDNYIVNSEKINESSYEIEADGKIKKTELTSPVLNFVVVK